MTVRLRLTILLMLCVPLYAAGVERGIEYGRVGNERAGNATIPLLLDASLPEGTGPFPAVILVHGGGWIGGHRQFSVEPLFQPLNKAGFAWFSISYRLATGFPQFGAAVEDVQAAVRFVRQNAAKYNLDPNRIALLGESAGAHLVSLAVERSPESVAAVVAMYPPTDLVSLAENTLAIPDSIRQMLKASGMESFIREYLRQMSPIDHVAPGLPPFLLVHGTADTIVPFEQSERMLKKLKDAGNRAELIAIEGGGHGLRGWERSTAHSSYSRSIVAWLRQTLDLEVQAAKVR